MYSIFTFISLGRIHQAVPVGHVGQSRGFPIEPSVPIEHQCVRELTWWLAHYRKNISLNILIINALINILSMFYINNWYIVVYFKEHIYILKLHLYFFKYILSTISKYANVFKYSYGYTVLNIKQISHQIFLFCVLCI